MVNAVGSFGRAHLFSGGIRQLFNCMKLFLFKTRGRKPFYIIHMVDRYVDRFNPPCVRINKHQILNSGIWSYEQLHYLVEAGIKSATTTFGGINYHGTTPLHLLRRITDGGSKSQIRFEAEMTGYLYVLKKMRSFLPVLKRK